VQAVEENHLTLVHQVLRAQEYWRRKGLDAEAAILNEHPASYLDEMHGQLQGLLESGPGAAWKHRPGGAFLLRGAGVSDAVATGLCGAPSLSCLPAPPVA
jgi:cyclic beta-1,2-glucan synthetase